ncbi:MAG TPA: hypothetical protein VLR88_11725 [Propionibacteriaceae bacterium]|nr:hypothetical protein [Propionibacteriaceae bacterium]
MAMREVSRPIEVNVVLLLENLEPFGAAAWQAIAEAAAIYAVADGWIEVNLSSSSDLRVAPKIQAIYLGREHLPSVRSSLPSERVEELLRLTVARRPATKGASSEPDASSDGTRRGSSGDAVADQLALVGYVGDALEHTSGTLVVVHDRPIQPPMGMRYLIWDPVPGGAAISFATLDPLYWGTRMDEAERLAAIRRRLRAALCSVLGTAIGLVRCDNPSCFLFANVDRVTRLDSMVRIGEEHGAPALTGRGYAAEDRNVDRVAEVVQVDDVEWS